MSKKEIPVGQVFMAKNRDRRIGENDENRTVFVEEDNQIFALQFTKTSFDYAVSKAEENTEDFAEYEAYNRADKHTSSLLIAVILGFIAGALIAACAHLPF